MMLVGIGGTGLLPGRNLDRFRAAYFRYSFSNGLSDGLRLFGLQLGDEYGGELFYHVAITPWCRLSGDLRSFVGDHSRGTAIFVGVSAQIKF
jgi:porin